MSPAPRIFYVIDGAFDFGGKWVNLDHVVALRRLGFDARFWVWRPPEMAPVTPAFPPGRDAPWQREVPDLSPTDVLVVGETYGAAAVHVAQLAARKVIHNQNPYFMFRDFLDLGAYRHWGAEAMIVPGAYSAAMVRRMGWDRPLHVVRPQLDPVFAPEPAQPRTLQIAAALTKRSQEIRLVRGILHSLRPDLADLRWVALRNLSRADMAHWLKRSEIFLAGGYLEGLGLPPLEAMWSGALVVGFHGGAGREYATPENGDWFGDDDHFEIAEALIRLVDRLRSGEAFAERRAAGRRTAETFSPANFERQLAETWRSLMTA